MFADRTHSIGSQGALGWTVGLPALAGCVLLLMACGGGGGGGPDPVPPKPQVWHQTIVQVNVDLRGGAFVLGQRTITVGEPGRVLVQFDGSCVSSDGDRIVLAASNVPNWAGNDGNTAVEAYDSDVNRHSFSHTRSYVVDAGAHTFYAVGENFVETAGTGIASVYGCLTVKFYPDAADAFVAHVGIITTNVDLSSGAATIAQRTVTVPVAGSVLVRFDGLCVADVGDQIVIAASDVPDWSPNDGNVAIEAIDGDKNARVFSHARRYAVSPGPNTFYAVAQQFVETAGNGRADFYASLTIEFFPDAPGAPVLANQGVSRTSVLVEGAPVVMGQLNLLAPTSGTVIVRYEGLCYSDVGDRAVLAASDIPDWSVNAGNVSVESVSSDYDSNCFSHSRAYAVGPGLHTFYGVCENFVETAGNGFASNYANLSAQFFPD